MFGSDVLEVAIGVVFIYMLLSLLCSTINEQVIARFLNLRAKTLEEGINNMLDDSEWVKQLWETPGPPYGHCSTGFDMSRFGS